MAVLTANAAKPMTLPSDSGCIYIPIPEPYLVTEFVLTSKHLDLT